MYQLTLLRCTCSVASVHVLCQHLCGGMFFPVLAMAADIDKGMECLVCPMVCKFKMLAMCIKHVSHILLFGTKLCGLPGKA